MNSPIGLWSILSENDLRDILTVESESGIGKTLIFYDIRASSLFRGKLFFLASRSKQIFSDLYEIMRP